MLYLNESDIRRAVTPADMLAAVENAFRLFTAGECSMIDRATASDGHTTMLYMPCFAGGYVSTKMLASVPDNPARGLPALSGVVMLNRAEDGRLEAVLDGGTVTALRTGAVGGLAAKYLSKADAHTLGLLGCGVQGLHQVMMICAVRDIRTILIRRRAGRDLTDFLERLRGLIAPQDPEIILLDDADEVLRRSDIAVCATPSNAPLFSDDPALFRGKLVIAVGSWQPEMRELPDAAWRAADSAFIELPYACEESGDLSQPLAAGVIREEDLTLFGAYLEQKKAGTAPAPGDTVIFKSVGMGIFDTCAAAAVCEAAKRCGLGTELA